MGVLSSHTLPSSAGAWLPNGKTLLTSSLDSTLIHWDPRTSQPIFKSSIFCPPNTPDLDPSVHGITTMTISPNGQIAACGSSNGLVKTVNLSNGNVVGRLTGHDEGESVEALLFVDVLGGQGGGKGVVLVSGGTDGKGFVWDTATSRVRAELKHDVSRLTTFRSLAPTALIIPLGTNHFTRCSPFTTPPSSHFRLGRFDPQDVGRPYRHLDSRAQRSSRSYKRCRRCRLARRVRRSHHERRRRGCLVALEGLIYV